MKKYLYFFLSICFFFLLSFNSSAQEKVDRETLKDERKGMHQLTLVICHSLIAPGESSGWITVPSWAFDYNYWISSRWAIGLHNDIILESFEVINSGNEPETSIERTSPVTSVAAVVFKPKKHSSFILGAGAEFAKEENLAMARIGYEYSWEIGHKWDLGAGVTYDIKLDAYDTWIIGLGVSRFFGGRKE